MFASIGLYGLYGTNSDGIDIMGVGETVGGITLIFNKLKSAPFKKFSTYISIVSGKFSTSGEPKIPSGISEE
jgi:hypothetical protein